MPLLSSSSKRKMANYALYKTIDALMNGRFATDTPYPLSQN